MAATPQYGAMVFKGASGKTYSVDIYVSDVNAARINWDGGSGAGSTSPTFWKPPENVTLVDFSMVTGCLDTEKIRLVVNGRPLMQVLRYVPHVTTAANRPTLAIGFLQNSEISAFQISD
jgi:hypothetical protein